MSNRIEPGALLLENRKLAQAILNCLMSSKIKAVTDGRLINPLIEATKAKLNAIEDLINPRHLSYNKELIAGVIIKPWHIELTATLNSILREWGHYLSDIEFCDLVNGRTETDLDKKETVDLITGILNSQEVLAAVAKTTIKSEMRTSVLLRKLIT